MPRQPNRRRFLQTAATAGTALGLGEWAALGPLSPANADEAKVTPDLVRFGPDIEPVVRLIEETPRDRCVAMMIEQLKNGLPYRGFLAALYLANIRTAVVNHPLAVLHSTHQLTLDAPVHERLLPTFWAMDSFKVHQQQDDVKNPEFSPNLKVLTGKLPPAGRAEDELHAAMRDYDGDRAERAVVALARTRGMHGAIEPLWHYGARDWGFIGHMAIWAANVLRTLETVGWQHAEAVLRVVVRNLMGEKADMALQSYPGNSERVRKVVGKLPAAWAEDVSDRGFVREFLILWRESTSVPRDQSPRRGEFPGIFDSRMTPHAIKKRDAACELVATGLVDGRIRAGAVWDAVHLAVGEMILSAHRGSEAGHSNTVTNALHYAFVVSAEPANRLLALLQAVGWLFHFRENMADKGWLNEPRPITELVAAKIPDDPTEAVEEILEHLSYGPTGKPPTVDHTYRGPAYLTPSWRQEAASKAFAFARKFPDSRPLFGAANRLLPLKTGWDPHPIKYALAARENCRWVSPEWQPNLLAAASCLFFGVDARDNDVADQIREAVRKLG